jgi:hypothetical protein
LPLNAFGDFRASVQLEVLDIAGRCHTRKTHLDLPS